MARQPATETTFLRAWLPALFALLGIAASGAALAWFARGPDVPFLAGHRGAQWILYPQPDWYIGHRIAELDTQFRRTFYVDSLPKKAVLELRAFRRGRVRINDRPVAESDQQGWKQPIRRDVTRLLHPGENSISVVVANDAAPPVLWLVIWADGQPLVATDRHWEASYAGAVWQFARPASAQVAETRMGKPFPHWSDALRAKKATLQINALLAVGLWVVIEVWLWLRKRRGQLGGLTSRETIVVASFATLAWFALAIHNRAWIAPDTGFDAFWHKQYIDYLQQLHRLPPADYGAEMHQPPLYYLLGATVLTLTRQSVASDMGVTILRFLSATLAATHVVFILLSLRLLFPDHVRRQLAGLVLAIGLPVHLFIFQYITNETLVTTLSSASIYLTLRIVSVPRPSWKLLLTLAVCLGAALLTKLTAVVLVVAVLCTLAGVQLHKAWCNHSGNRGDLASNTLIDASFKLAAVVAVMLIVGGWHYARMYYNYGTPFPRQVEHLGSSSTWVAPGYHTLAHLTNFHRALERPYFSGLDSFPDAIFTTCWGDARYGGSGRRTVRPPWDYELMTLGYFLALIPCSVITIGALLATVGWTLRPNASWFLLLSLLALMAIALSYENIRHPHLTVAKAWYGLPASVALCALGAWGAIPWQPSRWWAMFVGPLLLLWALTAWQTFWVDANTPEAYLSVAGKHVQRKRYQRALPVLQRVLEIDNRNAAAYRLLGIVMVERSQHKQAIDVLRRAVQLDPADTIARFYYANALKHVGEHKKATEELRNLLREAPDFGDAYVSLAVWQLGEKRFSDALQAAREGLRLKPRQVELHVVAAEVYFQHEQRIDIAQRYVNYALRIDAKYAPALKLAARIAQTQGQPGNAVAYLERAMTQTPHRPEPFNSAAWILATTADKSVRNPKRALQYAQRACMLTVNRSATCLRTLAAAQAAAEQFDKAVKTIDQAIRAARLSGEHSLIDTLEGDRRSYRARRPLTISAADAALSEAQRRNGPPLPSKGVAQPAGDLKARD